MVRSASWHFAAAVGTFLALSVPSGVRGDAPTPGIKRLEYTFAIDNAGEFPDYIFLAYPWSLSNGAPTQEVTLVTSEPVSIGRWTEPAIYALKKSEFQPSVLKPPQNAEPSEFAKTPGIVKSNLTLAPVRSTKDSNPVNGVHDILHVTKCCEGGVLELKHAKVVYALKDGTKKPFDYGPNGERPLPDGQLVSASDRSETLPSKGGCAGCASSAAETPVALGALGLAGALALLVARKRRRE